MNVLAECIHLKTIRRQFNKTCVLLLIFMSYSMHAKAILPGPNDYQCEISHLYFLDENGIEIDTDFSTDVFYDEWVEIPNYLGIQFSNESIVYRPPSEEGFPYGIGTNTGIVPNATLDLTDGICTVGLQDSSLESYGISIGSFYNTITGVMPYNDVFFEVEFTNFKNVRITDIPCEYMFHVSMAGTGDIWGIVEGTWDYGNLYLEVYVRNIITGEVVTSNSVIEIVDPETASVYLRMQIEDDGYTLTGAYNINDSSWQEIGTVNSPWQITGYTGNILLPTNTTNIWLLYVCDDEDDWFTSDNLTIHPRTLNLDSNGNYVNAHISLPDGHTVDDIVIDSIRLEDSLIPEEIKENNEKLIAKFSRSALIDIINEMNLSLPAEVELTVTGDLSYGKSFEMKDTITVISNSSSEDTPDMAVADLDDSIGLEKEAETLLSTEDFDIIKQLIEDSGTNHSNAVNNINKIWKGKELEILVPSIALSLAQIVDDFIFYVVLGYDEQWRRDLAQIIIPTPIALREYVRDVIDQ